MTHGNGVRIADKEIYLKENRYEEPKEITKSLLTHIPNNLYSKENIKILDIGCAAGEFLYHCDKTFKNPKLTGLDVVKELLEKAKIHVPNGHFFSASIEEKDVLEKEEYDLITMVGVLSIFDNPEPPIINCLNALKPNGTLIIGGSFNENPIDTLIKYKRSSVEGAEWESGWNNFSKETMETITKRNYSNVNIEWHDFKLPFKIEKQEDPMRSWTENYKDNPNFLVNGANILIDFKFMIVTRLD